MKRHSIQKKKSNTKTGRFSHRRHDCIRNAAQCDTLLKCERLRAPLALILSHSVKHFAADWLSCPCSWSAVPPNSLDPNSCNFHGLSVRRPLALTQGTICSPKGGKRYDLRSKWHFLLWFCTHDHACSLEQTSSLACRPLHCHSHHGWTKTLGRGRKTSRTPIHRCIASRAACWATAVDTVNLRVKPEEASDCCRDGRI